MKYGFARTVFLALILACGSASAASFDHKLCPAPKIKAAIRATDAISDWARLHSLYQRYHMCDAGAVAGNFGYNTTMLLIGRWDTLPALAAITDKDKAFQSFIIRHITPALSPKERATLTDLAHYSCPEGADALCKGLRGKLDALKIDMARFHQE